MAQRTHVARRIVAAGALISAQIIGLAAGPGAVPALARTKVNSTAALRQLMGKHLLTLQWVSWDTFGSATVTDRNGQLHLTGSQKVGANSLRIDGDITQVDAKSFGFRGTVTTTVDYINGGEPCARTGTYTFAITGTRRYWRMRPMENPCEDVVDYVDLYLR